MRQAEARFSQKGSKNRGKVISLTHSDERAEIARGESLRLPENKGRATNNHLRGADIQKARPYEVDSVMEDRKDTTFIEHSEPGSLKDPFQTDERKIDARNAERRWKVTYQRISMHLCASKDSNRCQNSKMFDHDGMCFSFLRQICESDWS
jgi:hypothetical protein